MEKLLAEIPKQTKFELLAMTEVNKTMKAPLFPGSIFLLQQIIHFRATFEKLH